MCKSGGWNHRVYRHKYKNTLTGEEQEYLGIHESYYPNYDTDIPNGHTQDIINMQSDDLEGLRWQLTKALEALDKSILDFDEDT